MSSCFASMLFHPSPALIGDQHRTGMTIALNVTSDLLKQSYGSENLCYDNYLLLWMIYYKLLYDYYYDRFETNGDYIDLIIINRKMNFSSFYVDDNQDNDDNKLVNMSPSLKFVISKGVHELLAANFDDVDGYKYAPPT